MRPRPRVHQLVTGVAVAAPVGVGALHDDPALLGQSVQHQVYVEVGSSLGPRSGHVLEVDQHGERALVLGQLVLQILCGSPDAATGQAANAGFRACAERDDASSSRPRSPPSGTQRRLAPLESRRVLRAPRRCDTASRECVNDNSADGDHRCLERLRLRDPHGDRQPHRRELRAPHRGRDHPRDRPSSDQGQRRRLRPDDLRPGLHEHGLVSKRDHLPRRRHGVLRYRGYPIEQLAEKSSFLEVSYLLLHGELPTSAQLDAWVDEITHHTFVHDNVRTFMQGFRYDAHPMGMLQSSVGMLEHVLPRGQGHHGRGEQLPPDRPPDRQDADARRLRLPAHHGQALRLPEQRALLLGELPRDALHDRRSEVHAGSAHREGPRRALHPPRRPRAELLHQRRPQRRLVAGGPLLGRRGRRQRPLRPAARRGQRGRAADAAPHREGREHPGVHRGREGRQGAPDGLRPPGLQELRPAGDDHQEGLRRRLRGHRGQPAARDRPSSSRRSRSRTSTSSSASSTRTSTSTRG